MIDNFFFSMLQLSFLRLHRSFVAPKRSFPPDVHTFRGRGVQELGVSLAPTHCIEQKLTLSQRTSLQKSLTSDTFSVSAK